MKLLRFLHLYLGCVFAPMLVFFAVSGIWQTFRLQDEKRGRDQPPTLLEHLSSIHTSGGFKSGSWSSPAMKWFVVIASVSFVFTMLLGIVMAFRYGRVKTVLISLLIGIAVPVALVLLAIER